MNAYFDASFLVSLFSADVNSILAARTLQPADGSLIVTHLAELEVVNAFQLRIFRGEITAEQAETSWQDLLFDLRAGVFQLRTLPEGSFTHAQQISRRTTASFGTRSADLLHVAAALELGCGWLYSFDERQRKLARALKLRLNPIP